MKSVIALACVSSVAFGQTTFIEDIIDNSAGDCKMVGDIDGDGFVDAVVGGTPGENLAWYHWPSWTRTQIAIPSVEFTTDGALADIDGDGDLDIIIPDGPSGDNLFWFENPGFAGDPTVEEIWIKHIIGSTGTWCKDVEPFDFDKNGEIDIAVRVGSSVYIFWQSGGTFSRDLIKSGLSGEGLFLGDINSDTDMDLIINGAWLENPISSGHINNWWTHTIGPYAPTFKAFVIDLDKDGDQDVLFSNSEGTSDVVWFEQNAGLWTSHVIVPSLNRCHTLQVADMDLDGDLDVITAQMHTSTTKLIQVHYNDGNQNWASDIVGNSGLHNGVVADFGNDGDFDIFGANWTGNTPIRLYENQLDPPCTLTCPGDMTTQGAGVGDPGFGVPDCSVTAADLNYYVNAWVVQDLAVADVTTQNAPIGDPNYGMPDGLVTAVDIQYFVNHWLQGCF